MNLLRRHWLPLLTLLIWGYAATIDRALAVAAIGKGLHTLGSVAPIIVAVFGLVGLIEVWLNREQVARWLGHEGGIRSLLIAACCGMLLIGPAYLIFPLLQSIREQGARWGVIVIVLTAWAVKIQLIPIEAQFLGWSFSLSRALFTLAVAIPLGLLLEWILEGMEQRS